MPNHVTTICTVAGSESLIDRFAATHFPKGEKGTLFDFGTIIPRPAIVDETESGSDPTLGIAALVGSIVDIDFKTVFPWLSKEVALTGARYYHAKQVREYLAEKKPHVLEKGKKCLQAIVETGYPDWYQWSIANWGTKWGAYDYEPRRRTPNELVFKFETAWAFPEPVFRKLAEMYPELVFDVISFDEGGFFACEGQFNGRNDYKCGRELATKEMRRRVYGEDAEDEEDADA